MDADGLVDLIDAHPSLLELLSWKLCSELARRHPDRTEVLETHPGGGQYDCLSLFDATGPTARTLVHANRRGKIHLLGGRGRDDMARTWGDYATCDDPRAFLLEVESTIGLDAPSTVPAATPTTLTYRAITAAIGTALLTPTRLTAHSGFYDSSGMDAGVRDDLFDAFPDGPRPERPEDAAAYWFLVRADAPAAMIHAPTASVRWMDGTEHNLHDHYASTGRHLPHTVASCLRPAVR